MKTTTKKKKNKLRSVTVIGAGFFGGPKTYSSTCGVSPSSCPHSRHNKVEEREDGVYVNDCKVNEQFIMCKEYYEK